MQIKSLLSASFAVALSTAQSMNNDTGSLTSLLSSNSNLSTLYSLIGNSSLASSVSSLNNITLFAPSNDALRPLLSTITLEAATMPDLVSSLLQYHMLQGEIYASEITSSPAFPHTMLNNSMYSNVTGGQVVECMLSGSTVEITSGLKMVANVTQANMNFTGGVVHIIDNVLTIPLNVSSTAIAAGLSSLAGALIETKLLDTVDSLSDVTIFAPTNDAFQAIGSATGNLSLSQLASILEYHVINGTVAYSSMLKNESITTLAGGKVTITIEDGDVFVNSAKVINPDVLVSGGVVHVIDGVLNPNATSASINPTASSATVAYSGASSGSAAPFTSGVPTPTSSNPGLETTVTSVVATVTAGSGSGSGSSSSSSAGAAPFATGAVGAAALFGGAALVANW